jgi:hypothetical protein
LSCGYRNGLRPEGDVGAEPPANLADAVGLRPRAVLADVDQFDERGRLAGEHGDRRLSALDELQRLGRRAASNGADLGHAPGEGAITYGPDVGRQSAARTGVQAVGEGAAIAVDEAAQLYATDAVGCGVGALWFAGAEPCQSCLARTLNGLVGLRSDDPI